MKSEIDADANQRSSELQNYTDRQIAASQTQLDSLVDEKVTTL